MSLIMFISFNVVKDWHSYLPTISCGFSYYKVITENLVDFGFIDKDFFLVLQSGETRYVFG